MTMVWGKERVRGPAVLLLYQSWGQSASWRGEVKVQVSELELVMAHRQCKEHKGCPLEKQPLMS